MTTDTKIRTITLTGRPPVRISEAAWPQIAKGEWCDDPAIPIQANSGCDIRVRQHADGRAIVHGRRWSRWEGARPWCGGELLPAGADIAASIERVGRAGDMNESVARDCIADLPAEVLE